MRLKKYVAGLFIGLSLATSGYGQNYLRQDVRDLDGLYFTCACFGNFEHLSEKSSTSEKREPENNPNESPLENIADLSFLEINCEGSEGLYFDKKNYSCLNNIPTDFKAEKVLEKSKYFKEFFKFFTRGALEEKCQVIEPIVKELYEENNSHFGSNDRFLITKSLLKFFIGRVIERFKEPVDIGQKFDEADQNAQQAQNLRKCENGNCSKCKNLMCKNGVNRVCSN